MIKVLFDHQVFDMQKYGGISRYFSELINHLQLSHEVDTILPFKYTENEYLKYIDASKTSHFTSKFSNTGKHPLFRKVLKAYDRIDPSSNINRMVTALKSANFDIFHPTYYDTYFLKYLQGRPFVLTVHDMIHEIYPEYFPGDNKTILNKKKLIYRAEKIVTVSENTKKDLLKFYEIPPEKIDVIYHGDSMAASKTIATTNVQLPSKYILYVGSRVAYKNFDRFIHAVAPILEKDKDLEVVCSGSYRGGNDFSADEIKLLAQFNLTKRIKIHSADDRQLMQLYEQAVCFVFPTLYEGFGIPVLEAFSCNCPSIISNTSSLPEVGGNAVQYFDPLNIVEMTKTIKRVILDKSLRENMVLEGKKQLLKFSWAKAAVETNLLYKKILDKNH